MIITMELHDLEGHTWLLIHAYATLKLEHLLHSVWGIPSGMGAPLLVQLFLELPSAGSTFASASSMFTAASSMFAAGTAAGFPPAVATVVDGHDKDAAFLAFALDEDRFRVIQQ